MPQPCSPPTALVLEDEPRFRAFLAGVLRDMDCSAVQAATAREAMQLIRGDPPDILLLDLNLPANDGMTFLEDFRRVCPAASVVIITAFGDLDSARRAIRLGVTEFLTKPCDLGEIERAIDRARRNLNTSAGQAPAAPTIEQAAPKEVRPLDAVERDAIIAALRQNRGNRSAAAVSLGISRRALYNKLSEYARQGHEVP